MTAVDERSAPSAAAKLSLMTMTAMVVGGMVGAGVFSLPRRFAQETGVAGALVAWLIAGTGMLMLAFVFQTLAMRKPSWTRGSTPTRRPGGASTWLPILDAQ
jgi:arginine:ornithine antiporter/lysine permease